MCGIAGFFDLAAKTRGEDLSSQLLAMTDAIAHRGPDGSGAFVDPEAGIGLGHRRLAIIDVSEAGHQPMHSADGRFVITFNGEVYNFAEIRRDLQAAGHAFRGGSDTEVMLAAIREWGICPALERFVGMFAFALWDRHARMLSLVRDRMGVKPLYWTRCGDTVLFGSELKALMRHPAWRGELDRRSVAGFLRYSYIPAPSTVFRDVEQVEPGMVVHVANDGAVRRERYWDLRKVAAEAAANPLETGDGEAVDRLEAILRASVSARMVSDVPLGAFLSGGIDSSVVVALMQAMSDRPVRTFSIGFEEKEFDEAPAAKAVARHLGTDHTELYLSGRDALDAVTQIPDWFDEPFADPSQLPTYLVARMARQHVTVALSGDGGDELFGGYPRYFMTEAIWRRLGQGPKPLRRLAGGLVTAVPEPWLDRIAGLLPRSRRPLSPGRKLHRAAALFAVSSADELHRRISEVWPSADRLVGCEDGRTFSTDPSLAGDVDSFLTRMRYYDMRTYLPDDIMVKVDRTSMAVSLEAREPLLDHRLVAFALSLPRRFVMRDGQTKWLLRQVLERHVPRALFDRPKMGFSVPTAAWIRGPLRGWAEELLAPSRIRDEGMFDPDEVARLWGEHQAGRANRETILWNLMMFQAWRERYDVR
ncbi:asparagine synthase (glutamine-hydrolyzing) [Afifella sp. IM 167]|uniref:asparagine synthase (glutamine-hydrolyzing) n=1 Tax=Afifella sp. IM 167 TaxID=2033586 RepID=UPI001CCFF8D4|nr:asparagine synthase (glutamine-hydrolyzing) [Afifella sp. IM 167]MBZ8134261.1 asparagine synthase (glutamine-hydrolyzing) [Afifella sp. IM 167]